MSTFVQYRYQYSTLFSTDHACLPSLLGVHSVRATHGDSRLTCLKPYLTHVAIQMIIKSFSDNTSDRTIVKINCTLPLEEKAWNSG
jgi:hypothetical protein